MAAEQAVAHIQAVAMYVQGLAERERDDAVQKQIAVLESMIKKLDGPGQVTVFKAAFNEQFHCFCNSAAEDQVAPTPPAVNVTWGGCRLPPWE